MLVCYLHCCRRLFITPTAPPSPAWQSSSLGSSHAAAVPPQRREGDGELRCGKAMPYAQQGQHHRLRFHLLCTGCGEQPAVPTSWGADSPGPHSVGSYSVRAGLPLIPGTAPIHPWAQTPPIPGHRHPAFPVLGGALRLCPASTCGVRYRYSPACSSAPEPQHLRAAAGTAPIPGGTGAKAGNKRLCL